MGLIRFSGGRPVSRRSPGLGARKKGQKGVGRTLSKEELGVLKERLKRSTAKAPPVVTQQEVITKAAVRAGRVPGADITTPERKAELQLQLRGLPQEQIGRVIAGAETRGISIAPGAVTTVSPGVEKLIEKRRLETGISEAPPPETPIQEASQLFTTGRQTIFGGAAELVQREVKVKPKKGLLYAAGKGATAFIDIPSQFLGNVARETGITKGAAKIRTGLLEPAAKALDVPAIQSIIFPPSFEKKGAAFGKGAVSFATGAVKRVETQPERVAKLGLIGTLVGFGVTKIPGLKKVSTKTGQIILGTLAVGATTAETLLQPKGKRAEFLGGRAVDIGAFAVGAGFGARKPAPEVRVRTTEISKIKQVITPKGVAKADVAGRVTIQAGKDIYVAETAGQIVRFPKSPIPGFGKVAATFKFHITPTGTAGQALGPTIPAGAKIGGIAKGTKAIFGTTVRTGGAEAKTISVLLGKQVTPTVTIFGRKAFTSPFTVERAGFGKLTQTFSDVARQDVITVLGGKTTLVHKGSQLFKFAFLGKELTPVPSPNVQHILGLGFPPITVTVPGPAVSPAPPVVVAGLERAAVTALKGILPGATTKLILTPIVSKRTKVKTITDVTPRRRRDVLTDITTIKVTKKDVLPTEVSIPGTRTRGTLALSSAVLRGIIPVRRQEPTLVPVFPVTPSTIFPATSTPLPFGLPKFFPFPRRRKGKKLKLDKRKFKYQPSLTAVAFGIRGKRPKKLTGLEIRPLQMRGVF